MTPGRAERGDTFKHVELEINSACDMDCFGCDRFSDMPPGPPMTLAQVRHFVAESLDLRWDWHRIRVLGGEPTLHPDFPRIVEAVLSYRAEHPKCFVQVLSNGSGRLAQYKAWLVYRGVDPHVESKERGVTPAWFGNTRICQVDRDPGVGAVPPCSIYGPHGCGIGLTRHGYFLDGAGASAARVAGIDCGVMKLSEVTEASMLAQAEKLCRVCGHWNDEAHGVVHQRRVSETGRVTGPYWTERIAAYRAKQPELRVYGA